MICAKCNFQNKESANFCENCGTKLFIIKTCPKCNYEGGEESCFCKNCGTKLADKPIKSPKPPKTKTKKLILAIIASVIALVVAVIGYFYVFGNVAYVAEYNNEPEVEILSPNETNKADETIENEAVCDWSSVYKQLLNDKQRLLQDFNVQGNVNVVKVGQFKGCLLYDIDANGTPEFFITYTSYLQYEGGDDETVIYSIISGKLVATGHFYGVRFFAEKKVPGVVLGIWGEIWPQYKYIYKNGVFTRLQDNYVSYPDGEMGNTIKVGNNIYAFNGNEASSRTFGNGNEFVYITGYEYKNFQFAYKSYTGNK